MLLTSRLNIFVALSFALVLATCFLWTGSREKFVPSFLGLSTSQGVLEGQPQTELEVESSVPDIDDIKEQEEYSQLLEVAEADDVTGVSIFLGEYDETPLKELCAQTSWVSKNDIVIQCHARVGGIGNIRQEILVCVRDAIEIGASMIRPTIMLRSEDLIEYQNGPIRDMSYMFDSELFDERLQSACPQLQVFETLEDVQELGKVEHVFRNRNLPQGEDGKKISVKQWAELNRPDIGTILVVDMDRMMPMDPVCNDPIPLVTNFGALFDLPHSALLLATHALHALSIRFSLPDRPVLGPHPDAFVGIHLRSEADAMSVGYTTYETQERAYLTHIADTSMRVIYAASGNTTSLDLFAEEAAKLTPPGTVVTKWDLLDEKDAEKLSRMTWDQQALVDYAILARSSLFLGVSDSSFSWGLVYTRQVFGNVGLCNGTTGEIHKDNEGEEKGVDGKKDDDEQKEYEDDLSLIWGTPRDWHRYKTWP